MHRLTSSAIGVILLLLTFLFGLGGLLADLGGLAISPTLFGVGIVSGVAAVAIAIDEHRRSSVRTDEKIEAFFGRGLVGLAILLGAVALGSGLENGANRNSWLVLAVIVALDGVSVMIDTHRLDLARSAALPTRNLADAILGVLAAALGLGVGILGVIAGYLGNPHAPAWLYAGVILALLSAAFMYDEQARIVASPGKRPSFPSKPSSR